MASIAFTSYIWVRVLPAPLQSRVFTFLKRICNRPARADYSRQPPTRTAHLRSADARVLRACIPGQLPKPKRFADPQGKTSDNLVGRQSQNKAFGPPHQHRRASERILTVLRGPQGFLLSRVLSRPLIQSDRGAQVLHLQDFHAPERTRTSTR